MKERAFQRIIGIDYSGGDTAVKPLPGLAVYRVEDDGLPCKIPPRLDEGENKNIKNWTRKKIAHWLVEQLRDGKPTLVGIDHAFSFPMRYFDRYPQAKGNWDRFLSDFARYWRTDKDDAKVDDIKGACGRYRRGNPAWKRLTEESTPEAKPVFGFDVKQGNVAYQSHAGIPWLRYIRQELKKSQAKVHFWPFDCWKVQEGYSVVAEVYPALWKGSFGPRPTGMTGHEFDAYVIAAWLSWADRKGLLGHYFRPDLSEEECEKAETEGWILGSLGLNRQGFGREVKA